MARDFTGDGVEPVRFVEGVVYGADDLVNAWVAKHIGMPWEQRSGDTALGIVKGKELVAGVVYSDFNGPNVFASIVSKSPVWQRNKRTVAQLFIYPFETLGAARMTCAIASSNRASVRLCERLGFRHEASLLYAAHDGSDRLVYRIFESEWRTALGVSDG